MATCISALYENLQRGEPVLRFYSTKNKEGKYSSSYKIVEVFRKRVVRRKAFSIMYHYKIHI